MDHERRICRAGPRLASVARGPTAATIYLHGIQSHGGWYEWSASLLADGENPVLMPDRRGSGLNQAARGDVPCFRRWLEDLDELSAWARSEFGIERFDVVGVSWGGKLAAAWALERPELVSRLLLIAPGLFPAVGVGLAGRAGSVCCWRHSRDGPCRSHSMIPRYSRKTFLDRSYRRR